MLDRALLARYLRQRAELGERELMLEGVTARELLAMLAGGPTPAVRECGSVGVGGKPAASASAPASRDTRTQVLVDAGTGARRASGFAMIREVLAGAAPPELPSRPEATTSPQATRLPEAAGPPETRRQPEAARVPASPRPRVPVSAEVREDASPAARTLQVLAAEAAACTACALATAGRRQTVFGRGDPAARLVVVGEAPGQEEDRTGKPFVGPAGKLLDLLLLSAGFPRASVYICNTLKCRPPQNRNPLPEELAACARFLKAQLEAIRPKVLLAVGKFAAQSLAASEDSISHLRGRVFRYEGIPLVVSYHPAYLLRSPQWTVTAWEDFQLARKVLDEQA